MATLITLSGDKGPLTRVDVPLSRNEQPERLFYALDPFMEWLANEVPKLQTGRLNAPDTPAEQLDNILWKWISGREMRYGRWMKDLMPREDEVWELKTADLRIFGWLHQPCVFIAALGDYADKYKSPNKTKNYAEARRWVVAARQQIDLDEPKFATGTFDALVSV